MKEKTRWGRIAGVSALVGAAGLVAGAFWQAGALELMLALSVLGLTAGWLSRRQGWLGGLIAGLPFALFQMTRLAAQEHGNVYSLVAQPDYWRLLVPACVVSTGISIMAALAGAWLQNQRILWPRRRSQPKEAL
ncbi:MAG: hypothetical protein ACT4O3_04025 [Elusimicrobiota bacterium]